jgi:SAM-dependent methyltransferase
LANELYPEIASAKDATRFPLELVMCRACKHVQLQNIVDPDRLFGKYIYKSGTSAFFRNHFNDLAKKISEAVPQSSLVVEIGSNDGFLLQSLEHNGLSAVGIEPSEFLAQESTSRGLNVIQDFLSERCLDEIHNRFGVPDVVIANNVFAHIDDMKDALNIIGDLLSPDGIFVFEVAHLLKLVENNYFDTIYHEHMSYHSLESLIPFLDNFNFSVFNVEEIETHGGSIRVYASRDLAILKEPSINRILEKESIAGLSHPRIFTLIRDKINSKRDQVQHILSTFDEQSCVFGYGAPAKLVTFLSEMRLEEIDLLGIIDDNLEKQGKYLPSSAFSISSAEEISNQLLLKKGPVICLIFPWNLGDELIAKLRLFMPKGSKAVCFFPQVRVEEF